MEDKNPVLDFRYEPGKPSGMSRLDQFAMAAMQGMLANPKISPVSTCHHIAKMALLHADAMIAESDKRG